MGWGGKVLIFNCVYFFTGKNRRKIIIVPMRKIVFQGVCNVYHNYFNCKWKLLLD